MGIILIFLLELDHHWIVILNDSLLILNIGLANHLAPGHLQAAQVDDLIVLLAHHQAALRLEHGAAGVGNLICQFTNGCNH